MGKLKNYCFTFRGGSKFFMLVAIFPFLMAGCQEKNYAKIPEDSAKEELQEIKAETKQKELVKRGAYLVTSIGCADCHSPKKMGQLGPEEIAELKLSGYPQDRGLPSVNSAALEQGWILMSGDLTAAVGPWGVSFAANITSDDTGIGNWSFEQFKVAMQEGKWKGLKNGRDLLPPMPWPNFAHLTDEDLQAMFAYLQSTVPVENVVPAPIPPGKLVALQKK